VNAKAFATRTPIKHVVFVVKENRTFDNPDCAGPRFRRTELGRS
jgi:hypothetical protein